MLRFDLNAERYLLRALLCGVSLCASSFCIASSPDEDSLLSRSIEELMMLNVSVASKREKGWFQNPAAVYVLSADEIQTSGVIHLADALRLVPGVQVYRVFHNSWAISIRGFTSEFSGKLLVLIDGRTIYSPHYGGVYWDLNDLYLSEIEKIEVVRGPGASVWGANAVNGVINIVTKDARDTAKHEPVRMNVGVGTDAEYHLGGQWSQSWSAGAVRLFTQQKLKSSGYKGNKVDTAESETWDGRQFGVRADWQTADHIEWMLSAAYHNTEADEALASASVQSTFESGGSTDYLLLKRTHLNEAGHITSAQFFSKNLNTVAESCTKPVLKPMI